MKAGMREHRKLPPDLRKVVESVIREHTIRVVEARSSKKG